MCRATLAVDFVFALVWFGNSVEIKNNPSVLFAIRISSHFFAPNQIYNVKKSMLCSVVEFNVAY